MKKIKGIVAVFLSVMFVLSASVTGLAENGSDTRFVEGRIAVLGKNGKYFDHVAYANTNPDLLALYGYDKAALWNHYVTCGVYENRVVYTQNIDVAVALVGYDMLLDVTKPGMSDAEVARAIHDVIVQSTRYDMSYYTDNGYVYDIFTRKEGVIMMGTAVCSGYADAYSFLCSLAGLKCETVIGTATDMYGRAGGHEWNRVMIDGQWLYVDCTYDDPQTNDGSQICLHDYCLIPEAAMNVNHAAGRTRKPY
ncbi:MAG: hypothetical protein K5888_01830 [Lachnospiraceae bacterium]|nr:hypothetical protein [Lachnospiraceae bacterium]